MRKYFVLAVFVLCAMPAFGQCLLTFQTETISPFPVGQPANFQIEGVSGTEPYEFTVIEGAPPEGLTIHKNGRITGVPRQEEETLVYITLSDAAGCNITQAMYIVSTP